jgi:hypothetical protein
MKSVPNMNRIKFATFLYQFHSPNFSVERVLLIASPSERIKNGSNYSWGPKLKALRVCSMVTWKPFLFFTSNDAVDTSIAKII